MRTYESRSKNFRMMRTYVPMGLRGLLIKEGEYINPIRSRSKDFMDMYGYRFYEVKLVRECRLFSHIV